MSIESWAMCDGLGKEVSSLQRIWEALEKMHSLSSRGTLKTEAPKLKSREAVESGSQTSYERCWRGSSNVFSGDRCWVWFKPGATDWNSQVGSKDESWVPSLKKVHVILIWNMYEHLSCCSQTMCTSLFHLLNFCWKCVMEIAQCEHDSKKWTTTKTPVQVWWWMINLFSQVWQTGF